jgi:hypothetical protein
MRRGRFAVPATLAVAFAAVVIPVADAGHGVIKSFGSSSANPALGGTFNAPRGIAVNETGAGGVAPGTIYVADGSNNRIGLFDSSGGFVSTWGQDVIQTGGAGDTGTGIELCGVAASCKVGVAGPRGGAFAAVRGVAVDQSTGDVYVTEGGRVQRLTASGSFLRMWGAGVVTGGATGTGTLANSSTAVSAVATTSKAFAVGQPITGAGIQPETTIAAVAAGTITLSKPTTASAAGTGVVLTAPTGAGNVSQDERQTVTLPANATGGTFTLTYSTPIPSSTTGTTAPIPAGASAAGIQSALEALANIDVGDIAVSGAAGGPWTIDFQGRFADTDVNSLTGSGTGLTVSSGTKTLRFATTVVGGGGAEVCAVAVECALSKSGSGAGQFLASSASVHPAVAPSGNVYVPDPGNQRVQEFTPSGSFVRTWGWDVIQTGGSGDTGTAFEICSVAAQCKAGVGGSGNGQFASPSAVAVDLAGNVYAADGGNPRVQKFDSTGGYLSSLAPAGTVTQAGSGYDLAFNRSTDRLLVGANVPPTLERRVEEFDAGGVLRDSHLVGAGIGETGGIGVDSSTGGIYLSQTADNRILVIGPESPPEATISPVTNVGATTARLNGTVTPPGGGLSARYRFEYSTDGTNWTRYPAADIDVGSDPVPVTVYQDVTGLSANTLHHVRLVASTGSTAAATDTSATIDFTTDAAPPSIAETTPEAVTQTTAALRARIDPGNLATTYRFEWGSSDAYGQRAPSVDATVSGSGPRTVKAPIAGLQPDTTYHFRVVATNAEGTVPGPDVVFRTLNTAGLPANRAYELVSPAGDVTVEREGAGVRLQASSDGQRLVWPLAPGLLDASTRDADGWTADRLPGGEYRYFSRDLSCGVLVDGDNLFRRNPDGSQTVLSNLAPTNAPLPAGAEHYGSVGASEDCGHVVFATPYSYPAVGASGLYEWDHGTLRNAGVLPGGGVATKATLGAIGGQNAWNAVSADGSRIFFSATSNDGNDAGKPALFVRRDDASTVKASASKTAVVNQGAVYQLASKSGSRVLFLANYGLTSSTSAGPTDGNCALAPPLSCDLYAYDVATGDLTDLSAHTAESGGAMVAGVLGASDDASHVYFAARGQLVPGRGRSVAANFSHGSYNVYLAHAGQRHFVGLLRGAEVSASAKRNGALVGRSTAPSSPWASRVTADGRHLLFPSSADVTGYDSGGVTEAYLYSADNDATVCVSCRRDGQPSVGSAAGGDAPATPLASDGSTGHGNPLQPPRTLSADGSRVFFEKPDALATGAVSGHDNVYEWSDGQVALLASGSPAGAAARMRFEDASDSGDDAFLSTREALLPQDVDGDLDVYAVRVDGGLPWTPPETRPPIVDPPPIFETPLPRAKFTVKGLSRTQRARLVAGKRVRLGVKVNRAGKVSVKGVAKIGGRRATVIAGSRRAKGAGTVEIPVALKRAARARIAKAGSLRVTLTVRFAGVRKSVVRSVVLRRPA